MLVQLKNISKGFDTADGRIEVIGSFSMEVEKGSFASIIGPSGCGKSTVLKLICGLLTPDQGEILIDGFAGIKAGDRISYMPQKDLLMPWRNVIDNIILPLEILGVNKDQAREEALSLFPLFGLEGFAYSYPDELSGGMSQRAALLRTMLAGRDIILLDEPFGALDAITRFKMQQWLQDVWIKLGKTIIFITHDIEEAIFLSDYIYLLSPRPGTLQEKIEISFPRPRGPSLLTREEFIKIKANLIHALSLEI